MKWTLKSVMELKRMSYDHEYLKYPVAKLPPLDLIPFTFFMFTVTSLILLFFGVKELKIKKFWSW